MESTLWAITFATFPALLIFLGRFTRVIDRFGLVLLCFASGICLNTFAHGAKLTSFTEGASLAPLQTQITELAIALALPLLIMSIDVRSALRHASLTAKALFLAFTSVLVSTCVLSVIFHGDIQDLWQVAGLSVGTYTGGGPNMAAINAAIQGDQAIFVRMTSYDMLLSALYLLFVLSIAKPLFGRVLKNFDHTQSIQTDSTQFDHLSEESCASYRHITRTKNIAPCLSSLCVATLILALSLAGANLLPASTQSSGTIILITTLSLLASFIPYIQSLKVSFRMGMYLVLVFCFTMGSLTNLSMLASLDYALFAYIGLLLVCATGLHFLLCRLFNVDVDTFLVTSSAAIMSVPFIPLIVCNIKNKVLLVPGFAAAIIGYVVGNYLGIAIALGIKATL